MTEVLSVREIISDDIVKIADYWMNAEQAYLVSMGVEQGKMPGRNDLVNMLMAQIDSSYGEKNSYAIIWLSDGSPIGHSNINRIVYAEEASLHLHLWDQHNRKRGLGSILLKMSLPYYFRNFKLRKLYSEPYALNPAPNNTLKKLGFNLVKRYRTIPGSINFEQEVFRWELNADHFRKICSV